MALNGLSLVSGKWNHVVLPLSTGAASGAEFDLSAITAWEIFAALDTIDPQYQNALVRLDEIRLVAYAEGDATGVVEALNVGQTVDDLSPTASATGGDTDNSTQPNEGQPTTPAGDDASEDAGLPIGLIVGVVAAVIVIAIVVVVVILRKKKA